MRIFNLRFGFATNSSSSHSLAFTQESMQDTDCGDGEFGWQEFVAASNEMKLLYVATLADSVLSRTIPSAASRQALIRHLLGNKNIRTYYGDGQYGSIQSHIDHQSQYVLPVNWETGYSPAENGRFINVEFLRDFANYFLQDGLVILGGNDNIDEDDDPIRNHYDSFTLPVPMDHDSRNWVARKDPQYGYWVMFNRENGTKVRFSFDNISGPAPERAFAPELLDIKITERCPFSASEAPRACARYCYQNSQLVGNELSRDNFYAITTYLRRLQVFEVALGGGEPTCHPNFMELLESFRTDGIIPNFSTRNLEWLRDDSKWPRILDACGSFAYSIRSARDIDVLNRLARNKVIRYDRYNRLRKMIVQLTMGTINRLTFKNILVKAGQLEIPITLLGYKDVGRGTQFNPINYDWWIDVIREVADNRETRLPRIAIDTTLAEEYEQEILGQNVPSWMFHTREGRFSGYLDAVTGRFGPSSFCDESKMFNLSNFGDQRYSHSWASGLDDKIIQIYPKFQ